MGGEDVREVKMQKKRKKGRNKVRETYTARGMNKEKMEGNSEETNKRYSSVKWEELFQAPLVTDVKVPFILSMDNFR